MPQFLCYEGHEGMKKAKTVIKTGIQSLLSRFLGSGRGGVVGHGFHRFLFRFIVSLELSKVNRRKSTHDVDVAKLIQPEVVSGIGRGHKVPLGKLGIDFSGGNVELVEDPLLNKGFVTSRLPSSWVHELNGSCKETVSQRTLAVGSGTKVSSNLSIANLVALKILLQNFLYPSTRRISKLMSRPKNQ